MKKIDVEKDKVGKTLYDCAAYACYLRDEDELRKSTSGGAFFSLAKKIIETNGVVFGAAFVSKKYVQHVYVERLEDLDKLRGSKYVQSNIGDSYIKVKYFLLKGRKVLFSGTPCQIAGLRAFLGEEYENLFTVDLICHGVPSQKLFAYYLGELEKEYGSIKHFNFRDKTFGWQDVHVSYYLDDGNIIYKKALEEEYYDAFAKYITLRPSCYNCNFRSLNSGADITIGDFWGIQKQHPNFGNHMGVSAVIIKSNKGAELFDLCKEQMVIEESSVWKIVDYNILLNETVGLRKVRGNFFANFCNTDSKDFYLKEIVKKSSEIITSKRVGIIGSFGLRRVVQMLGFQDSGINMIWHITNSTIFSMAQEKTAIDIDECEFINEYRKQSIKNDFYKTSEEIIRENRADVLFIDLLEERFPVLVTDKGIITKSEAYLDIEKKLQLTVEKEIDPTQIEMESWEKTLDVLMGHILQVYKPEQIFVVETYLTENIGLDKPNEKFSEYKKIRCINEKLREMYNYMKQKYVAIRYIALNNDKTDFCYKYFGYGTEPQYYCRGRYKEIKEQIESMLEEEI